MYILKAARFFRHALEEGRILHIGGTVLPLVGLGLGGPDFLPLFRPFPDIAVPGPEHLRRHGAVHGIADFLVCRPDILEIDRVAVGILADGIVHQIDFHGAGDRIGDHQWRRGEIVGLHLGVHPAFEVPVARQNRGHRQVAFIDGVGDRFRQGAGIADTGGAAIADKIEAKRIEIVLQARLFEIIADHLRAGCERRLDPRLDLQALGERVPRHEAGAQHHRGVGRIGAAGDGGNDHVAILKLVVGVGDGHRALAGADGRDCVVERAGGPGKGDFVLRALGAGERRLHRRDIQLERIGKLGIRRRRIAPHALRLGISLDQRDAVFVARRETEIAEGLFVDREDAAGRAVFRRHIGDGGPVGQRQGIQRRPIELDEFPDHALLAQHLHDGKHQIGSGRAFLEFAGEFEPDDLGDEHGNRLTKHGRFRLDTADTPTQHTQAVDHGGMAVRAHQGIRIGDGRAVLRRPIPS